MTRRLLFLLTISALLFTREAPASVAVNQAGYMPGAQKLFYATAPADSFFITEQATGTVYLSGKLAVSRLNDAATGMSVYKGDFSALKRQGTYVVALSSSDRSVAFSISDTVFRSVAVKALRGFYYQRCGVELRAEHAGSYARAQCHTRDGFFHATTDTSGFQLSIGGWHDAGDYGKYIVNAGVTVGTLLMAYELFPARFNADATGIPESGNGVPDILDETRFELEWMLTMQHASGGVYFKLTRAQFEGFVKPSADDGLRYLYQLSTTATGDFAAVMARAARTYRGFDTAFADACLAASRRAWDYLKAHAAIVPTGGFKNPTGTATGEYGDTADDDERMWAAAELYSTTGEAQFNTYYSFRYGSSSLLSGTMGWQSVRTMAHLTYLYTAQPAASSAIKAELRQSLIAYGDTRVSAIGSEGFAVAIRPGEYSWGSNSEVLNRALLLILASREAKSTAMYNAALSQFNYILGANAHNLSFVTGVGARHVMNPHHRPSASDAITEPVPGLVAGGPEQNRSDDVLKAKFTTSTPPALVYIDDVNSYASNEIAINWNAPLVFVAGYFAGEGTATAVETHEGTLPTGFHLDQNFPNPFNPSTTISFALPVKSYAAIDVFDTAGRRVSTIAAGMMEAGYHSVAFDAGALASGVYLYRLSATANGTPFTETKRFTILK